MPARDQADRFCGQVAGAYYGESGIPESWRKRLVMRDEIRDLADRLRSADSNQESPR